MDEDPQYEYLGELFKAPMEDVGDIIYDRLPVSNYIESWKDDPNGRERYLKSRVNPSGDGLSGDGHFVTDDAPIKVFMDFLIKSVINYN